MNATDYLAHINKNIDDWYSDTISYSDFSERSLKIWNEIGENDLIEPVMTLINRPQGDDQERRIHLMRTVRTMKDDDIAATLTIARDYLAEEALADAQDGGVGRGGAMNAHTRKPTLYFDTMRGLVPVRRRTLKITSDKRDTWLPHVEATVARTTGAWYAGMRVTFSWTSLVVIARRSKYQTLVKPAIDSATYSLCY